MSWIWDLARLKETCAVQLSAIRDYVKWTSIFVSIPDDVAH